MNKTYDDFNESDIKKSPVCYWLQQPPGKSKAKQIRKNVSTLLINVDQNIV